MENSETEAEPNILYEFSKIEEWHQSYEVAQQKVSFYNPISTQSALLNPWRYFEKTKLESTKFLQSEFSWQLAVSQDGKVLAIVQDSLIEIRSAKDGYSTVVGKAQIPADQHPQLRKVSWSNDNTFLAVARDVGAVYVFSVLGTVVATVASPPFETTPPNPVDNSNSLKPITGLIFVQPRTKDLKWSQELFIFYYEGSMKSVLLSSLGGGSCDDNARHNLDNYFPQGISAVAYHRFHPFVVICGNYPSQKEGITLWRILQGYPHLKIVSSYERETPGSKSFLRFFPGYAHKIHKGTVIKMKISANGETLASLHYSGDITIWCFPSMQQIRRWSLSEQPYYTQINPRNSDNFSDPRYTDRDNFFPVDLCWWSETALAIARRSGIITVCSLVTLNNLLGESPVYLSSAPQISSTYDPRPVVIALECEAENKNKLKDDLEDIEPDETSALQASIQAALYSFTDIEIFEPRKKAPRMKHRTYRLFQIKHRTPDELFTRKIESEEYDLALMLAYKYNLDCDLVYQKRWTSTTVSKETIHNYLEKVKNTLWVVSECVRRVPDTFEITKELLEFGLKKTEVDHESIDELDCERMKLVSLRRQILSYLDNLTLYKMIIKYPSKYRAEDYQVLRNKSAVINTVNFARDGNIFAVSTMLCNMGHVTLRYWLPVISNIPETVDPVSYERLLPRISKKKVVPLATSRLREADWSEAVKYNYIDCLTDKKNSNEDIYQDDPSLNHFEADVLTPALVEEWYKRRIYEIEKNTGLVLHAEALATLGKEKNVKSMEPLLFHLKTLNTLTYNVQAKEISLTRLESLTPLEQAKLFFPSKCDKNVVKILNEYIYPFSLRCKQQGVTTPFALLQGLMLWLSEEDLCLPLEIFKATKTENALSFKLSYVELMRLAINCVYNCEAPELDSCYRIIECLPTREQSVQSEELDMHDKIDVMESHLEICDILRNYKIHRSPRWILENEENKNVARILMQKMANYTKNETSRFNDLEYDLQQLQIHMFSSLDRIYCFELVAYYQMSSEKEKIILSAASLMQCSKDQQDKIIPFGRSVELVLKAAKCHFQRATNYDSTAMHLSRVCLNLITDPHPLIWEELELIQSIQSLYDFGVELLPIQVRNYTNKMKLIQSCLEMKPQAYKSVDRLLEIANCFQIYGEDKFKRECEVLILSAKFATYMKDFAHCREICSRLITGGFSPAWDFIYSMIEKDEHLTYEMKREYISFALSNCPKEELQRLVESSRRLRSSHVRIDDQY